MYSLCLVAQKLSLKDLVKVMDNECCDVIHVNDINTPSILRLII